jgi:hypothetical protein
VGRDRNIVAFSAICAHKLAYPTREVSFIRYQPERSPTSGAHVIHCCADHSVYDPAEGARVVSGPAPQPLAAILLEYDAAQDSLFALGTVGAEQFDAFFDKYRVRLALEYGEGRARANVAATRGSRHGWSRECAPRGRRSAQSRWRWSLRIRGHCICSRALSSICTIRQRSAPRSGRGLSASCNCWRRVDCVSGAHA